MTGPNKAVPVCNLCAIDYLLQNLSVPSLTPNESFYRPANASLRNVGRNASEHVTLRLIYSKYIPIVLYGLEACTLTKSLLTLLYLIGL